MPDYEDGSLVIGEAAARTPMVVFLEAAATGSGLRLIAYAETTDINPVFLTTDVGKYAGAPGREVLDVLARDGRLIVCDSLDAPAVPTALAVSGLLADVVGVICAADRFLLAGAAIAETVGAPLFDVHAAQVIRDKREMRKLLGRLGIRNVAWANADSTRAVHDFAQRVAGPVVIKNVRGSGSQQVLYASTPAEAGAMFDELAQEDHYLGGELMLEEFVSGPLVSLEGFVFDGRFSPLGFTDREFGALPFFVEIGWTFPAPQPDNIGRQAEEAVQSVVDALQIRGGPLHVEFLVSEDGPVIVDFNARLPGSLITPMLQALFDERYYDLVLASSRGTIVPVPSGPSRHGAIRKVFPNRGGTLTALTGLDLAAATPGVREVTGVVSTGITVTLPRDYRGSLFQLWGVGASAACARQTLVDAAAAVTVEIS